MDCAADQLGIDPVELRRRNLIRSFPYRSVTGLLFDEGSYLASLERAAAEIDLAGVSRAAAGGARRGPLSRHRLLPVQRAHRLRHARLCRARHGDHAGLRAGRDQHGPVRLCRGADRRVAARPGSGHDARPADRRRARRRAGEDPHHPWRHRPDALRLGHLCQPLDGDLGWRLQARRRSAARQAREARRPCAGGGPRRHRDRRGHGAGARHRPDHRARDAGAPRPSPEPPLRRCARPASVGAGDPRSGRHLLQCLPRGDRRGRSRDRPRRDRALPGGRGRRRADQSHDRRGPGPWRRRPGHRQRAARGDRLRRRGQHPDRLARRLSAADLRRDPADRHPPHRDRRAMRP